MRRLLLAAAISAVVLGVAACSDDKTGGSASAPPPPGAGFGSASAPATSGAQPSPGGAANNAGDAALSGDSEAICNQAAKTGSQFGALFTQDLKLLIDAESAKDQDASAKAKQKTARDVENYSFALADMSKLAADPTLKQALADMSKQVTALKGDVRKLDDGTFDKLRARLDKACGR